MDRKAFPGICRFGQCGVDMQDDANRYVGEKKLAFFRPYERLLSLSQLE